jgi:hypothetical protein
MVKLLGWSLHHLYWSHVSYTSEAASVRSVLCTLFQQLRDRQSRKQFTPPQVGRTMQASAFPTRSPFSYTVCLIEWLMTK